MDLFSTEKAQFKLPQAELFYIPKFYKPSEADKLFKALLEQTLWQQDQITVFGKTYKQPRLTALYAENHAPYTYSGITMKPHPLNHILQTIKQEIELISKHPFNSVLLNLYRDGMDSNGWHADNEKELGTNPVIASLSLGAKRRFKFKHRTLKQENYSIELEHGSLLIMKGDMQHYWLHQIPKTTKNVKERINLTFRLIS